MKNRQRPTERLANRPWVVTGCGVLLVLATCWSYSNSFAVPFVFDDLPLVYENPSLQHYWPATSVGSRRIVGHLTLAFNRQWGGLRPLDFHILNALIHATGGLLLFGLVRRTLLLPGMRDRFRGSATFLGFATALVWLVHPLQTEAVTYVIQRLESLMAMFYLLFLYALLRGSQAQNSWPWYVLAVIGCTLGLATKEVMVTAPMVALAYDRTYLAGTWREIWRKRSGMYLACLPAWLWMMSSLIPETTSTAEASVGLGVPGISPLVYLLNQGPVICRYLRLAIWPDVLCLDYGWPATRDISRLIGPCLVVTTLLGFAAYAWWRWPRVGFLGIAFFAILSPTSSVVPVSDLIFEHRMYLPLAPLVCLAVLGGRWVIGGLCDRRHSTAAAIARYFAARSSGQSRDEGIRELRAWIKRARMAERSLAVAALHFASQALGVRTIQRNLDYHNCATIWGKTVAVAPHNARAQVNYAGSLYLQHEIAAAKEHLEASLALQPMPQAYTYLGQIALDQHRDVEAESYFQLALELRPNYSRALDGQGKLLLARNDFALAEEKFAAAVASEPTFVPGLVSLADAALKQGKVKSALATLRQALSLWPENPEALRRLAWILSTSADEAESRNGVEAEGYVRLLFRILTVPKAEDFAIRAAVRAENGRFDEAIDDAATAIAESDADSRAKYEARQARVRAHLPIRENAADSGR